MNDDRYIRASIIQKKYDIAYITLKRWGESGKIRFRRTDGGKRLYLLEDVERIFEGSQKRDDRKKYIYARVSSNHQKEDLERQIKYLTDHYPEHTVIKDIGSGLNWKRKGFMSMVDGIMSNLVSEVVVAYKDRLCRFGYELLEQICKKFNTKLLVHNENDEIDYTTELSNDLLSIVTVFVARHNGKRAKKHNENKENTVLSDEGTKDDPEKMVWSIENDV